MTTITKKRGPKRKSSFYHLRWNKVGLNEERAAEVLGVSVDEIRRYDTIKTAHQSWRKN